MGHRLTILKNVYDLKMRQELAIEPEHYVPLSMGYAIPMC